ncbi:MAG TPA: MaoC/PaaZ C-terminal domain-containing protein, partial [Terriglobales bacterium]|nr:MaoC/PaaZ C-terminal domain-containing protein [Terriglobales bacterium]
MPPLVIENLDDLKDHVGRAIATTDWFAVTQDRIQQFAEVTEDRQWIHLDRDRGRRESPYATTIAHGFLTLSLLSHLLQQALQIRSGVSLAVNYGLNRVRFPSPVRADSKIRARFTLQALAHVGEADQAVFSVV